MKNNKIIPLELNRLSNAEFVALLERFLQDLSKSSIDLETDADLKVFVENIREQLPVFKNSLDQIRGSEVSKKITTADTERDASLKAIRNIVKAYQNTTIPSEKEAFEKINLLISEYKGLENNSYEAQNTRIANLVDRLQSSTYKKEVNELLLGKFVTRLAQADANFKTLFSERSLENSQKQTINTKEVRTSLSDMYRKIGAYIFAVYEIRKVDFYKDFIFIYNNSRKYFADTLLSRRGKKKEGKMTEKESN